MLADAEGEPLGTRNTALIERLLTYDAVIIAGQAKSHCVAWTVDDLIRDPTVRERGLLGRLYLLEDCTSPVVVPGAVDYTDDADAAFARFAEAGVHIVRSTEPMASWPERWRRPSRSTVVGAGSPGPGDRGRLDTRSRRGFGRKRRPTFAASCPSASTMSAV